MVEEACVNVFLRAKLGPKPARSRFQFKGSKNFPGQNGLFLPPLSLERVVLAWASVTKYHRPDGLNNTHFSESWRLEVQGQRARMVRFLVWDWLLVYRWPTSLCIFTWQGERERDGSQVSYSFCKNINSIMNPTLMTQSNHNHNHDLVEPQPQKAPSPNTITMEIRF